MNLWELIWRSIQQRRLSSSLTAMSVALGVMLVVSVLLLRVELEEHFLQPGKGYALIVGAPGSSLQLVLNSVYHIDKSPGLIPYATYEELQKHPSARLAVPYAVGDSFRGFRVVGTTDAFFSPRFPHPAGKTPASKLALGRPFQFHPEDLQEAIAHLTPASQPTSTPISTPASTAQNPRPKIHENQHENRSENTDTPTPQQPSKDDRNKHENHDESPGEHHGHHHEEHDEIAEAVVGSEVARQLGVRPGDRIEPTHGVEGGGSIHEHEHLWTVVGVLKPTGTPVDKLVLINLDSFYRIPDHSGGLLQGSNQAGLSAIVLFPRGGMHKALLLSRLNKRTDIQIADVNREVRHLFDIVGNIDIFFLLVSLLVVLVGLISIMVAIYNTMNERRREIAILRALGARQRSVMAIVLGESMLLALVGALMGIAMGHGLVWALASRVEQAAGFRPDALTVWPGEPLLLIVVGAVGALAGLLPAWKAYRTDVRTHLSPTS